MTFSRKIFWIAGENSGDLHTSKVISQLNRNNKNITHFGIGGENMQKAGLIPIFPFERFSVMGFSEVIKHLFFFLKVEIKIKKIFKTNPPDLVVLTDYPGLNMRIAKMAHKFKIKVLYFICPQFWAWKHKRIFQLKKYTDYVAFILPFEEKYFKKENVKSSFVGHPISEEIEIRLIRKDFAKEYNLNLNKKWLGFLPGSRDTEIKKMLPEYIKSISFFDVEKYEFLISKAVTVSDKLFRQTIENSENQNIKIIKNHNYEMMKYCDFLVVTSGTATLETAYLGTPFLIVYKTSKISYELGKRFIKIKRIGLPNIVLDKDIIPELIQDKANGKSIYNKTLEIINSKEKYDKISEELKELHEILGIKSASKEVAKIIENLLNE